MAPATRRALSGFLTLPAHSAGRGPRCQPLLRGWGWAYPPDSHRGPGAGKGRRAPPPPPRTRRKRKGGLKTQSASLDAPEARPKLTPWEVGMWGWGGGGGGDGGEGPDSASPWGVKAAGQVRDVLPFQPHPTPPHCTT